MIPSSRWGSIFLKTILPAQVLHLLHQGLKISIPLLICSITTQFFQLLFFPVLRFPVVARIPSSSYVEMIMQPRQLQLCKFMRQKLHVAALLFSESNTFYVYRLISPFNIFSITDNSHHPWLQRFRPKLVFWLTQLFCTFFLFIHLFFYLFIFF